jgi:hypothetical protein
MKPKCYCNECQKRDGTAPSSLPSVKSCTSDTEKVSLHGIPEKYLPGLQARSAKPTDLDRRAFLAKVRKAIANGAEKHNSTIYWNLSAKSKHPCERPRELVTFTGYRRPKHAHSGYGAAGNGKIGFLTIFGRCRKCAACAAYKKGLWITRAIAEAEATRGRIWFVTLTSGPEHRNYVDFQAKAKAFRDRKDFEKLDGQGKFKYRAQVMRGEVSAYLKRVRKGVGPERQPKIRFLCVTEPHKDFIAHAHLLVYERDEGEVTERLLRHRWRPRGICEAKLARTNKETIAYVAKYLGKDLSGTIHASQRFGQPRQEQTRQV